MFRLNRITTVNRICCSRLQINVLPSCNHSKTPEEGAAKIEPKDAKAESKRLAEFRKKLRETSPIGDLGDQPLTPPTVKEDPLPPWPDNKNPHTGERNGPRGPEPTRYGDWERKGRVSDF
ncbi:hypothetical protein NE865_13318 [Phthorimaea operculella]|nr:hypothetical protein NE865_13318 [Phthorimaea operculella]